MNQLPKAALFDFDGTLFDSMWVWRRLDENFLRRHGVEPPPDIGKVVRSMTLLQSCLYFQREFGLPFTVEEIAAQIRGMVRQEYEYAIDLKPGAGRFVALLRRLGRPMAVVTASDEEMVRAALRRVGLESAFAHILTPGNTGLTKATPAIFHRAAEQLGLLPEACTVFEDSLHAAEAAAVGGFPVVGIYEDFNKDQWPAMKKLCLACYRDFEPLCDAAEGR